jgi:hypothetical protein
MERNYYLPTTDPKKVILVRVYCEKEPELVSAEILETTDGKQWESQRFATSYIATHGSFSGKTLDLSRKEYECGLVGKITQLDNYIEVE